MAVIFDPFNLNVGVNWLMTYQSKNMSSALLLILGDRNKSKIVAFFSTVSGLFSDTKSCSNTSSGRSTLFSFACFFIRIFASGVRLFDINHLADSGMNLQTFLIRLILLILFNTYHQ